MPPSDETLSMLERARRRLYAAGSAVTPGTVPLEHAGEHDIPGTWDDAALVANHSRGRRHVRYAGIFFAVAVVFFIVAVGIAGYLFYYGSNAVSVNNVSVQVQGPTTIAAGDTVPLSLSVTNRNSVAIHDATLTVAFPDGTRSADNLLTPYPRYSENLGTILSGQTITRSVKAVVFGGAGQALPVPINLTYTTGGSNAVFVKKTDYALSISSTPLSVSVDTRTETVSGKPLSLTLLVRSNASVPLDNVVLSSALPFGFSVASSSSPLVGGGFLLGTLAPGDKRTITLVGTLTGQDKEQRVFRFTVGTAKQANDPALAIPYMTQDASVTIAAPFLATALSINGASISQAVLSPGAQQSVSLSYTNTLATNITNATVSVTISGAAVNYNSIRTTSGFYRSSDHTIVFSRDTSPDLAVLAPGATGQGNFTFTTQPSDPSIRTPAVTFTISVAGTRVGQANVPEAVSASAQQTVNVASTVLLSAQSLHSSGPFSNSGPVPPVANTPTTYTIVWNATNEGSAVAGGTVSAILPSYVTFTGRTTGSGTVAYDNASRTVSWNAGDFSQGSVAQAEFQVSLTPSTSQVGSTPILLGQSAFSGYDRFANVQITSQADPVTTEVKGDPGYVPSDASVQ